MSLASQADLIGQALGGTVDLTGTAYTVSNGAVTVNVPAGTRVILEQ